MGLFDRLKNRMQFQLEWLLLRGPLHRVFVIAMVIALVSLIAGLLATMVTRQFSDPGAAIWWAFLRLTDPGYLGDDQGMLLRFISTVVTVIGYVLFMGSLIAIMTQWLNSTIERLEKGLTPVVKRNHIVVLGWGLRSVAVVRDLMLSEGRVRRFLDRLGGGKLHVCVLAEEVSPTLVQELKDRLGSLYSPHRVTLRSGSPLHLDHLRRVDFLNAAAILLPGHETIDEDEASQDAVALKTLLSTSAALRQLGVERMPLMVTELSDARAVSIATRAYGGPIEVVASDQFVARLIAQTIRHQGLSRLYSEMLSQEGSEVYLPELPELVGYQVGAFREAFDQSIFLGIVRPRGNQFVPILDPPVHLKVKPSDRIAVLARDFESCGPRSGFNLESSCIEPKGRPNRDLKFQTRRVLCIGWNQTAPEFVRELTQLDNKKYELDVLSSLPQSTRLSALIRRGVDAEKIELRHFEGDSTSPSDLSRIDLLSYDSLVLLASDRLESEVDSDARTAMTFLMVQDSLRTLDHCPQLVVELNDAENVALFAEAEAEVIVSPRLLGHVLSQVVLRRELRAVFDELFGPSGAEITFQLASDYGLEAGTYNFQEIQRVVWGSGEIALGLRSSGALLLNPNQKEVHRIAAGDEIVVLTMPLTDQTPTRNGFPEA